MGEENIKLAAEQPKKEQQTMTWAEALSERKAVAPTRTSFAVVLPEGVELILTGFAPQQEWEEVDGKRRPKPGSFVQDEEKRVAFDVTFSVSGTSDGCIRCRKYLTLEQYNAWHTKVGGAVSVEGLRVTPFARDRSREGSTFVSKDYNTYWDFDSLTD